MKKIYVGLIFVLNIFMVMCSSNEISNKELTEMKCIIDKVLSYDGDYDDEVNDYIDETLFYEANYVIFYSFWIGEMKLTEYESVITGVSKDSSSYNICMLVNMEGQATTLEQEGDESGYDTVEGKDVPIEITISKNKNSYFIDNIIEYESLDVAEKSNVNFKN